MKYPYISKSGNVLGYLVLNESNVWLFQNEEWITFNTREFKNDTPEFLANTYGEVKSKEHAHFIVELGEGAGYELVGSVSPNRAGVFVFDGENKTLFFMLGGGSLRGGSVLKQITIPLPPESKDNDSLKNNGDNLMFGGADKCEEWPCVNDEVLTSDGNGVVKLLPDSKGYYVVSINGEYYQYQLYELEKPKTTEQELRDEIINCIHNHNEIWRDNNNEMEVSVYEFVGDALLSKYNITKKPQ